MHYSSERGIFKHAQYIESRPTIQLSTPALQVDEEKGKKGEKGEKGAPKPKPVVRKQPPGKLYDEAFSPVVMQRFLDYQLEEYNLVSKKTMDLVVFRYLVSHVVRVGRVLKQPNGHVFLLGSHWTLVPLFP